MKMMLVLSRDDVRRDIPYAMICETRYGSRWQTSRRRRLWKEMLTEQERKAADRLFRQSHLWHLVRDVPEEIHMTMETYRLWGKLADFCAAI